MVSSASEDCSGGSCNEIEPSTVPLLVPKIRDRHIRIDIPPLQTRLPHQRINSRTFLGFLRARLSRDWFMAPFSVFRRTVDRREETSLSVPSPAVIRRRLFLRKIDWVSLRKACKKWIRNPMNIALLLWLICVAGFLCLLFLLLTDLIDAAFPTSSLRDHWVEICNQVLNALFTLMCLYQHPNLFHHLVLLCRWRSEDIIELRKLYCKNGAYRPHEWAHMMVVVVLLHIACFSQYLLCGLYWGFRSAQRPEIFEELFVALGVIAPVISGVYIVYSPLGRECDSDTSDEESQGLAINLSEQTKLGLKLREQRVAVSRPEWIGGLFDLGDDVPVAFLSFFCTCCVFGWNMGRLGFGNTYVHIATFVLLFIAPYWIFSVSAHHIQDGVIRHTVRITGLVLSFLSLLYGGFWRIQIRKRFGLPANTFCCGVGSPMDYVQWMFCWGCSLAQEVRTGNFYDVEEDSLYRKYGGGGGRDDEGSRPISPPPSAAFDGGASPTMGLDLGSQVPTSQPASLPSPGRVEEESSSPGCQLLALDEGSSSRTGGDDAMVPPAPVLIQVEDRDCNDERSTDRLNSPKMEETLLPCD